MRGLTDEQRMALQRLLRKLEADRVGIVDRFDTVEGDLNSRFARMVGAYEVVVEGAIRDIARVLGDDVAQAWDRSNAASEAARALEEERRTLRRKAVGA